jgi:hypothetical protein
MVAEVPKKNTGAGAGGDDQTPEDGSKRSIPSDALPLPLVS